MQINSALQSILDNFDNSGNFELRNDLVKSNATSNNFHSISDFNGKLALYFINNNIYNSKHQLIKNGDNLICTGTSNQFNKYTLVIGDEICRGTEEKSANIIVAYMLETLSKSNSSFITATHLHKVASLETVKKLENVKAKHLKITYDPENEQLIYDRHLSDGQGESFYGLMVAKFLMKDKVFNTVVA